MREDVLLARCRKGNPRAFEELVELYEKKVYNLAYRMLGNMEDARDITQDAFIKVYSSLSNFRGDSSFSTWLFKIVSNMCLDELRRRGRRSFVSLDEPLQQEDGEMPRQMPDLKMDLEKEVEDRYIQAMVHRAILSLTADHRMVIALRDLQGFSYEEIAEMMDCSLGTVKSRINRARLALRRQMEEGELFLPDDVQSGRREGGR